LWEKNGIFQIPSPATFIARALGPESKKRG
jgi:hypothetical protein